MTHQMILSAHYPTGAQEWTCPTCGRMFIMQWEPWRRVVMVDGDAEEVHTGGLGGLSIEAEIDELPDPFDDYFKKIGWMDE